MGVGGKEGRHTAVQEKPTTDELETYPTYAVLSAVAVAGAVVLLLIEILAPVAFIPTQLRILAAMGAGIAAVIYTYRRLEAAAERRHREILEAISAHHGGTEYIRGYVDGIARRMPEEHAV